MSLNDAGAGVLLAVLLGAGCPALAQASAAASSPPQASASTTVPKQASRPIRSFVPSEFEVPVLVETKDFKVVPLGPELARIDFDAYMSSIEHLQSTFTRSTGWPREGITDSEALQDMQTEQARFASRASFAYSVLTPDGTRERGCIYVYPSKVEGYDAMVRMWVTKAEYDAGFDAKLYAWATKWIKKDWPFAKVAYPGRSVDWATWDALLAANKPKQAGPLKQEL